MHYIFHDWRTVMCGSLYRTCCLSLSPFLSTPKKLLLQKDLCLPLGERPRAPHRRQYSGRGGCNRRRRSPASKAPRRVEPGAADQAQHRAEHHGTELQADGSRTTLNLGV